MNRSRRKGEYDDENEDDDEQRRNAARETPRKSHLPKGGKKAKPLGGCGDRFGKADRTNP